MKKLIVAILSLSLLLFGAPAAKTSTTVQVADSVADPNIGGTHPIQPPV